MHDPPAFHGAEKPEAVLCGTKNSAPGKQPFNKRDPTGTVVRRGDLHFSRPITVLTNFAEADWRLLVAYFWDFHLCRKRYSAKPWTGIWQLTLESAASDCGRRLHARIGWLP